jgi:hypothetical protein
MPVAPELFGRHVKGFFVCFHRSFLHGTTTVKTLLANHLDAAVMIFNLEFSFLLSVRENKGEVSNNPLADFFESDLGVGGVLAP